ncbi:7816_t:CDS:2 [Entrophospora sp. SA101]|nr:7816_t:CDS:2 [Entrophospora sp. SA101]
MFTSFDPKYGTDMKDKHGVDNSNDIIIDYERYERLAINKSSESSSEKYSNQKYHNV